MRHAIAFYVDVDIKVYDAEVHVNRIIALFVRMSLTNVPLVEKAFVVLRLYGSPLYRQV